MAEIYWLLEPDTRKVRYIGCAKNAAIRTKSHWRQRNSTARSPVKDWLCSLAELPEFQVVQVVPDEQAQAAETYWTEMLRETSIGPELLNLLDGRNHRNETKRKIAASSTGKIVSEEVREKVKTRRDLICKACDSGPFTFNTLGLHRRWHCEASSRNSEDRVHGSEP